VKRPATSSAPARESAAGIIRGATDTAYSLQALGRETGLREHGLRQLRALGLPMPLLGRQRWILGEDFVALIRRLRDQNGRQSDSETDGKPRIAGENAGVDTGVDGTFDTGTRAKQNGRKGNSA
jgi:hypothetical protein